MRAPEPTADGHSPAHRDQIERERLASLYRLDLLDDRPDERFDRIARIASRALATPLAQVTLIDADEQRFAASLGYDIEVARRSDSFCTNTIVSPETVLVAPDVHLDERFADVPFVTGPPYIRFYAGIAVNSPEGQPIGTVCVLDTEPRSFDHDDEAVLRDLGALVEREVLHTSVSLTDSLTGLANRRAFVAAVDRFLRLGARRSDPVSVVFADVNRLKVVNDELGHADGDAVLRRAAHVLSVSTRASDVAARVGGDEFAIVLYGSDADAAATVIEHIRAQAAADSERLPDSPALSIALGAATSRPDDTVAELVGRADAAMFDDKRSS